LATDSISLAALCHCVSTLSQNTNVSALWVHTPMTVLIVTIVPYDSFYPFWVMVCIKLIQ